MMLSTINIGQKLDREISLLLRHAPIDKMEFQLTKDLTFDDFLSDKLLIIRVIRTGIPFPVFELIKQDSPFGESDWAEFLDISLKSLQLYHKKSKTFNCVYSEKILAVAEVSRAGLDVFGDTDKFRFWLNTPSESLENMKPKELIKYSYGKDLILSELTRIGEGTFA
jgi:putative toxin-antitoxin system antitoxin component (TIGR02293 family)